MSAYLLCRVLTQNCALAVEDVVETMRRSTLEPVVGAPDFVLGVSVVRGTALPVVDCGKLLCGQPCSAARYVILRLGDRAVALAVDEVLGVRELSAELLDGIPPLLAGPEQIVAALSARDERLLAVLSSARLVPDSVEVWGVLP